MDYYWPTMVKDLHELRTMMSSLSVPCQFHSPTTGTVAPNTIDYFSKWAEAVPRKEVKKENVAEFIRINIIYRYGIPRYIITDYGKPFCNSLIDKLTQKFNFKQRKSSMYNAAANRLAEAFNKTLSIQEGLTREENARLRLEELEALDEKRLEEQQRLECYQARLSRVFNKKMRSRSFQVGYLVLAVRRPIITTHRTGNKFTSKWDGPYFVKEVYTNGAYKLIAEDGLRICPINGKFLKRYYA
ncbi:UNVERIFIED_CONTAM: hypothetical protein Scaly_2568500 [Sesamum calycinum]|uniref:Integrase catalytic domain-containing protein n=1 Tax=Sesamum calycinum TaxID=2727403 RepID=A0AAW2K0M1_9LAMI